MTRQLHVQELESRIAPSTGLGDLLNQLGLGGMVNPDGTIDAKQAADLANQNGANVQSLRDTFNVNSTVVSDKTAQALLGRFGK